MIAEAIDTAVTLGWALAVWIVLLAFFASLALYAVAAIVWAVGRMLWAAVRVAAPRRPLGARVSDEQPASDSSPATTPQRRSEPHVPAWARTDKDAA